MLGGMLGVVVRAPWPAARRWRRFSRSPPLRRSARCSSCWRCDRSPTATRCGSSWSPSAARSCLRQLALHLFGPDERAARAVHCGALDSTSSARRSSGRRSGSGCSRSLAVVALAFLYRRTAFGKAMRATSIHRDAARLVGIDAGGDGDVLVRARWRARRACGPRGRTADADGVRRRRGHRREGVRGGDSRRAGQSGRGGGRRTDPRPAREPDRRLPQPAVQGRRRARRASRRAVRQAVRACSAVGAGRRCDGRTACAHAGALGGRGGSSRLVPLVRRRPLPAQGAHVRGSERARGGRPRAAVRLRGAGLARARGVRRARRLHLRVSYGASGAALDRAAS